MTTPPLLEIKDLRTHFNSGGETLRAVDGISLTVNEAETVGLVGESGCGKSVSALSIMRLVQSPPGQIVGGEILFEGRDLLKLSGEEMRRIRGKEIGMVFQEPMTSLNPTISIGRQISEPLEIHLGMTRSQATTRAAELLHLVGIPDPVTRLRDHPHQLSGGQRQRVMIAIGLSCNPKLLIADEPTTALDVTIQAQILELMLQLTAEFNTALLIITHNLGVVARYADKVIVMYAGKIRESASAADLYRNTSHPYTLGLLNSVPRLDVPPSARLASIEGEIPDPMNLPPGCAFAPRCKWAVERCNVEQPPLTEVNGTHVSACWEIERLTETAESAR